MSAHLIDDSSLTKYHKRLIIACSGGPFLDGYLLSIVGVALGGAQSELHLSTGELGLAGAVSLVGLFFGSLIFGPLTDRIGRRAMYTADLLAMILASFACLMIGSGWEFIALRFIIGLAVGADYPIATSLLTEWIPKRQRGAIIGFLSVVWLFGAIMAYVVGYLLITRLGPESWRLMLASGGVFGIIVLLLRMGAHESPRWLIAKGRTEEARHHIEQVLDRPVSLQDMACLTEDEAGEDSGGFFQLLRGVYLRRVLFCGLTWTCFALPQFAMFTYGPIILSHFGFSGGPAFDTLGQIILNFGFFLGAFPGMWMVERFGRRPLIVWSFLLAAIALLPLGIWPTASAMTLMTFFFLFTVINGTGNILVFIYPNELFPTGIRASAVGLATAISRIGAAVGTFLVPVALEGWGTGPTMLAGALITFLGFVISVAWAEETRNRNLSRAAYAVSGA